MQPWFQHIDLWTMQRFVGRCAAAIHRNAPGTLVTLGSGSLKFNRDLKSEQSCDWWPPTPPPPLSNQHQFESWGSGFTRSRFFHHPSVSA